ncbi:MAG: hypothetical protein PQJ44_07600 [Sphaerochaetaceae bacterium]|nr:hypothetical protein [Sphaerochaetaceae bacterium]
MKLSKKKTKTLLIIILIITTFSCNNIEKKKIRSIESLIIDEIGNEIKKSYTEYDDEEREIIFIKYNHLSEVTYSRETKYTSLSKETNYFDIQLGNSSLIQKISDDKPISGTLEYENKDLGRIDFNLDYDKLGNLIRDTQIKNGEEQITVYTYKYDDEKVIEKKQEILGNEDFYTNNYIYDGDNIIIEIFESSSMVFPKIEIFKEYNKKNELISTEKFIDGKIQERKEYDNGLVIKEIKYRENNWSEIFYRYQFDKRSNWIKKESLLKTEENESYRIIEIEKRNIEYY